MSENKAALMVIFVSALLTAAVFAGLRIDKVCGGRLPAPDPLSLDQRIALAPFDPYAKLEWPAEESEERLSDYAAEMELVARVVAAEARGEPFIGQMAVAQVIADRASLWNMTLTEAVNRPGQFAKPYQGALSDETLDAVQRVLESGDRVFEDHVTHFHEAWITPYWTKNKAFRGQIGNHKFYY